jgi:hypothetical protein
MPAPAAALLLGLLMFSGAAPAAPGAAQQASPQLEAERARWQGEFAALAAAGPESAEAAAVLGRLLGRLRADHAELAAAEAEHRPASVSQLALQAPQAGSRWARETRWLEAAHAELGLSKQAFHAAMQRLAAAARTAPDGTGPDGGAPVDPPAGESAGGRRRAGAGGRVFDPPGGARPAPAADGDGDLVVDASDAFPADPAEWNDADGDRTGDNADVDDDGDGVWDSADAFPFDPRRCELDLSEPAAAAAAEGAAEGASEPTGLLDGVGMFARGATLVRTFPGFISPDETEQMLALGERLLAETFGNWSVEQARPGSDEAGGYRTAAFSKRKWHVEPLLRLQRRVAALVGIPAHADAEAVMFAQSTGTKPKKVHHDRNQAENRVVTVLVYLDAPSGGHTMFPCLGPNGGEPGDPAACEGLVAGFARGRRILSDRGKQVR